MYTLVVLLFFGSVGGPTAVKWGEYATLEKCEAIGAAITTKNPTIMDRYIREHQNCTASVCMANLPPGFPSANQLASIEHICVGV